VPVEYFVSVAPEVFQAIRDLAGLPTSEYLLSLGFSQFLGNMLLGKYSVYTCQQSQGKSGSLFFISHDSRFMLKAIPERESQTIHRILPFYFSVSRITD
jgi:hypothetical protein